MLVVAEMAMTEMACEPAALMDQDTWLAAVLTSRPTVALDGDTLTLTAEGTRRHARSTGRSPTPIGRSRARRGPSRAS